MKNGVILLVALYILSSCDPASNMEATIENATSQTISIDFVSNDENLQKSLQINAGEIALFQEGFDVGDSFIEPSLIEYDSVVVKGQSQQILNVYKPNDSGKNIYNVDDYWITSEPSKRMYKYVYKITNEDIE